MDKRSTFLAKRADNSLFHHLFDYLPGVSFFAKNCQFEIMCANRAFLERLGFHDESEIVGKTDFELFPRQLAENFRKDDTAVMDSGEARLHIVELFFNQQGIPDWYITNKLPIFDRTNNIIGVMGTVQSYERRHQVLQPLLQIDRAVQYIRENFREQISISKLASMVDLSTRQLNRRFQDTFRVSSQAFIMKLRLQAACEQLRQSNSPIAEIAIDLGFHDQSSFTLQFRKQLGITPSKYRKSYR
jgi:AraC-like DNA-binding protein